MDQLRSQTAYDPQPVEKRWSVRWVEEAVFRAGRHLDAEPCSIVIPPPNVTGVLHIGHALVNTVQDVIARFERMRGKDMLWLPGTDHAGIATQVVVERNLATEEGLSRYDLGREAFVERVWDWKRRSHGTITSQLKRLGASVDWSRERFTLDEELSAAVREAFCRLYDKGLIYRGRRITHWCPTDHTALSDEEVEHTDHQSKLWTLRYPLEDGSGAIDVATTRPETMLGDSGVAVNPEDDRYRALVGRCVTLPLMERRIPIVADDRVDIAFGTGAVKVTPAHDPLDFEIGLTHGLEQIQAIGLDGTMTEATGAYAGLSREECREAVLRDLRAQGALVGERDYAHSLGRCQRCDTVIEPLISSQWFLRMPPLAQRALQAARNGEGPRWYPERWERIYLDWLERLGDWCISRQLWWGHRIPVWTCGACGDSRAYREDPSRCPSCAAAELTQDEDVLDTWFSSGLWPFSTMGWPDESAPDLKRWFPTTVLVTAYDIIFFWVVRMVTMSLEMTGRVPFAGVFIHGLVRDEKGRKVSKSLGNAIDPLEIMESYGTDALRYALTSLMMGGQDVSLGESHLVGGRNFANKVYNASRFTILGLEGSSPSAGDLDRSVLPIEARWILSRTAKAIERVASGLESLELGEAAQTAYHFWWSEFCDWYVEMAKPALYGEDAADRARAQAVLHRVLSIGLRLLHPIMPYITEELWQALPGASGFIAVAPWPSEHPEWCDDGAEATVAVLQEITRAVRAIRAEKGVPPSARVRVAVRSSRPVVAESLASCGALLGHLARVAECEQLPASGEKPRGTFTQVTESGIEVLLYAEGAVDLSRERKRLGREIASTSERLERVRAKLANGDFTNRAPAEVVAQERQREAELTAAVERLRAALEDVAG